MAKIPIRGKISTQFEKALTKGQYASIIRYALKDKELDIQVRDGYIDIYYRGGRILDIHPASEKFDKFYFYDQDKKGFPKTYVEKIFKKQYKDMPKHPSAPVPTDEEAAEIMKNLEKKRDNLTALLKDCPEEFFRKAKEVMNKWFITHPKPERQDQQIISTNNNCLDKDTDLCVIDIEFKVSENKPYNNSINEKGNKKTPAFDIIAVDGSGQIYVVELKENERADSTNGKANIDVHKKDFENTIGRDIENDFAKEMARLLETKQRLNILPSSVKVDPTKKPIFAVAYSGKNPIQFNNKYSQMGIKVIEVRGDSKKLYLQ